MTKRKERERQGKEKWFADRGNTCFYSGVVCYKTGVFSRSIEHLLPHPWMSSVKYTGKGKELHRKNKVVAVDFINHKIDVAPLQVKFALKKYLSKIGTPPGDTEEVKTTILEQVDNFIATYEINGYLPWNYRYGFNVERCQSLRVVYDELLSSEEGRLLEMKVANNRKMFLPSADVDLLLTTISVGNPFLPPYQKYLTEGA